MKFKKEEKILTLTTYVNPHLTNRLLLQRQDYIIIKEILDITHQHLEAAAKKTQSKIILSAYAIFSRIRAFSEQINITINLANFPSGCDHIILSVNARAIIEAVEMLFFVFIDDDVTNELKKLRILCLELHNTVNLIDELKNANGKIKFEEHLQFINLDKEINEANEYKERLDKEVDNNELLNDLKDPKGLKALKNRIKAGNVKYYHEEKNKEEMIEYIEDKMKIIPFSMNRYAYFYYSTSVHPFFFQLDPKIEISTNPENITNSEYVSKIFALIHIIKYLRYSTAKTIDQLLSDGNKDLLGPDQIANLQYRRKLLDEKLKSIPSEKSAVYFKKI